MFAMRRKWKRHVYPLVSFQFCPSSRMCSSDGLESLCKHIKSWPIAQSTYSVHFTQGNSEAQIVRLCLYNFQIILTINVMIFFLSLIVGRDSEPVMVSVVG